MRTLKLSQSGYTFVETLVMAGVLGLSLLAWAQLTSSLNHGVKSTDNQIARDSLANLVRETMKYSNSCQTALVGQNNSVIDSAILNQTQNLKLLLPGIFNDGTPGDDILTQNTKFKGLDIQSVTLVNTKHAPGAVAPTQKYYGQIRIEFKETGTGIALRSVDVGGFYFTVFGGSIASCETEVSDAFPLCVEMGCSWRPTTTPSCQCSPINLVCPPQQYATGIDASGSPVCTPLGGGACAANQYLKGLTLGQSECVPLPAASSF